MERKWGRCRTRIRRFSQLMSLIISFGGNYDHSVPFLRLIEEKPTNILPAIFFFNTW